MKINIFSIISILTIIILSVFSAFLSAELHSIKNINRDQEAKIRIYEEKYKASLIENKIMKKSLEESGVSADLLDKNKIIETQNKIIETQNKTIVAQQKTIKDLLQKMKIEE